MTLSSAMDFTSSASSEWLPVVSAQESRSALFCASRLFSIGAILGQTELVASRSPSSIPYGRS